tara:strand:+ start:4070 stop:4336 length:267 start_codon:yes stop_codon:yes gene_type:complete
MGKVKSYFADVFGNISLSQRDYPNRRNDYFLDADYRRGYHQGYSQAIDDQAHGKNLLRFFNKTLTAWRFGKKPFKPISEMDFPPFNVK